MQRNSGSHLTGHSILIPVVLALWALVSSASAQLPELIGIIPSDTTLALFGRQFEPMGDQNNDGYDDLLTTRGDRKLYLYYGGPEVDSIPDVIFDSLGILFSNIGDVSGDGYDDFTANRLGESFHRLYYGGPSIDTVVDYFFGGVDTWGIGKDVLGDDVDESGNNELISWDYDQQSLLFYDLDSALDSAHDLELFPYGVNPGLHIFGWSFVTGDFNGDGDYDLAVSVKPPYSYNANGYIYLYWGGATFDTIPDMTIRRVGNWEEGFEFFGTVLASPGDVNGDGYDDLFASGQGGDLDTLSFLYFGGPSVDTIPDVVMTELLDHAEPAGDLNSDGHPDIITSWPTPWSGTGHVLVYYGGPDIDGIPDIVITNDDMPQLQWEFGIWCSGIGDFNGDGIDDFAFSAEQTWGGRIYIFSGPGPGAGVETEYDPTLPTSFSLSQNYPNPFNPSTTIEFQLPERTNVTLTVSNILGQQVVVLVERTLSAGTHKIVWDGSDNRNRPMPSGVYLYHISTSTFTYARKMLLLK